MAKQQGCPYSLGQYEDIGCTLKVEWTRSCAIDGARSGYGISVELLTGEHSSILWEGARAGALVLAERLGSQPKLSLNPYGSGC